MKEYISKWSEQITPWLMTHGLKIVVIIVVALVIYKIMDKFITKTVRIAVKQDENDSKEAEEKRENTLIHIISGTLKIVFFLIAVIMILQEFGVMVGPIIAAAGIVGLALGFGGQYLIRDVISGLFIILENQYRIGDVVEFDNASGVVEDISLRKTTLRDLNGTVHHIPHGEIKKVSNKAKDFARINMNIGISYTADLENVIRVIDKVGVSLAEDPAWKEYIIKAPKFLRLDDFADSAMIVKILGETIPLKQWEVSGELRKRIKQAFDAEGIEIPFPQMVINQAGNQTT